MAGIVPNTGATYARQAVLDAVDLEAIQMGSNLTGVVSGCATTTAGGVMTVAVAAGVVRVAGKPVTVAGATSDAMTAHASLPKWYLVTVSSAGAIVVTAGTQAADPKLPSIPATSAVVAAVYLPAATSAITASMIVDKRVTVADTRTGIIVAATDAPAWMKSSAHFVCDGTADDVQIQAAIDLAQTYLVSSTYGVPVIYLTPGAYRSSTTVTAKSAPIVGLSVTNVGTRWYWDGADGGTVIDKDTSAGQTSFWRLEHVEFLAGSGNPDYFCDFTGSSIDQMFHLQYLHFNGARESQIYADGWVNCHWNNLRFDNWAKNAIRLVPGGSQNNSTFVLDRFTCDNQSTGPGEAFIRIDGTAVVSNNLGVFHLANGRIEINVTQNSPKAIIHLIEPSPGSTRAIGIEFDNITIDDTATGLDNFVYLDTAATNLSVSLSLRNVRQGTSVATVVGGTLVSGYPTIPAQSNYGYVAIATGGVDAMFGNLQVNGVKVTSGAGAPSASDADGSIYLRTDGVASTTLYVRAGGAWSALT